MSRLWTAVVPLRWGSDCKTRLAHAMSEPDRSALVQAMAMHVVAVLGRCPTIGAIAVLSPQRLDWWSGDWIPDRGRGLNEELLAWHEMVSAPCCIFHADLPFVDEADVAALLALAERNGAAFATDRSRTGCNAMALFTDQPVTFHFGPDSRARHEAQFGVDAIVSRAGLSTDIDVPDDLALLDVASSGNKIVLHSNSADTF